MSSRVARKPITVPKGIDVNVAENSVDIKGPKGLLSINILEGVSVISENGELSVSWDKHSANGDAQAGTLRALLNNAVTGVSTGYQEGLQLFGVGYRAKVSEANGCSVLELTLGLSHPVVYKAASDVKITSSAPTEITITGINKQRVGQTAADIRNICGGIRKPEPYKGKGIRYLNEKIVLKETKKK